jgi:hypothetical protein
MRVIVSFLVVACIALAYLVHSQSSTLKQQQEEIKELGARVQAMPKNATLELQEKCAKQAREEFNVDGWEKEKLAGFSNHYNVALNKCFILIENTDTKTTPGTIWTNKTLTDAFEGKVYGEYMWHSDKVKKYWEVPPVRCKVTTLSGEEQNCASSGEFDALLRQYME